MELVNVSFLSDSDKETLGRLAADGVDDAVWKKFDDLLLAVVEEGRQLESGQKGRYDAEVAYDVENYRNRKHELDRNLSADIRQVEKTGDNAVSQLWDEYYKGIAELQQRLLEGIHEAGERATGQAEQEAGSKSESK